MALNKVLDSRSGPSPPGPRAEPVPAPASTSGDRSRPVAFVWAALFVGLFGVFLASFPARNVDIWKHLADGRDLLHGVTALSPTWLYDLVAYALYSAGGETALAAVKALLGGVAGILLLRISTRGGGWRIPLVVTGLAVLAMASRLLLHPATVSVLFLVVTSWLLLSEENRALEPAYFPGWRLVVLFAVWANADGRVVLGLGFVALTWLGRALDARSGGGFGRTVGRRAVAVAILAGASSLSPSHVNGLRPPAELRAAVAALRAGAGGDSLTVNSPFNPAFLTIFRDSPAALAFYPLLALGLLSFVLARRDGRWAWFLPWLGFAVVSSLQVRLVPFFAVVAGPVTAWNLQAFFSRQASSAPVRSRLQPLGLAFTVLLAAVFLICSWTGWLQGPPFEPRRWAIETPAGLERGADYFRRTHAEAAWPANTRTLHGSGDTAESFAWFCPEDPGIRDDRLVAQLVNPRETETARQRLRELGVTRMAVFAGDPGTAPLLARLLARPDEWSMLSLAGGVAILGWRDPEKPIDPFAGRRLDFDRLAYRPDEHETAPGSRTSAQRRWWDAFWKPAPPAHPPGRDEATILLRMMEAEAQTAPARHQIAWELGQMAGLVGAGSGWAAVGGLQDAAVRVAILRPPIPEAGPLPAITELSFALRRQFEYQRGDAPVGLAYASIRAARRAVNENPYDPYSHLALGLAYGELVRFTAERGWGPKLPELIRLRQVQASTALNRALQLNPRLAIAHLEVARLYLTLDCHDLALDHFRAYLKSPRHWDGPAPGSDEAKGAAAEVDRLTRFLDRQRQEYARESERLSVSDRAHAAVRRGLGGEALNLLLKSDLAAFGRTGMELELDLLLRTGRPDDVLEWITPEVRGSIGESLAQWYTTQALAAVGEYDAANTALLDLTSLTGRMPAAGLLAREIGLLLGKAVLDEAFGARSPPEAVVLALNRSDYRNKIDDMTIAARRSAEITVLRGVIALEGGFIDRAREAFLDSLSLSPHRWGVGQLEFNARSVARECLSLLSGAGHPPLAIRP